MASSRLIFFIVITIFSSFVWFSHARKLLEVQEFNTNMVPPQSPLDKRLYLSSLPKGRVPSSTPSKKEHSVTIDEKLIARHLAEMNRNLRSVPSPGVGH